MIDPEPEPDVPDFTGDIPAVGLDDLPPEPELVVEAEPAPGMSSISDIKAKLLKKA